MCNTREVAVIHTKSESAEECEQSLKRRVKKRKQKNDKNKHGDDRQIKSRRQAVEKENPKQEINDDSKRARNEGDAENVKVSGNGCDASKYSPFWSFEDTKLQEDVLSCCKSFESPSPIQAHAWPFILDGRDFIGIAKTGSGKTLAYGIPAVMHVLNKKQLETRKRINPLCLVLAPTRELACQIATVLHDAGECCGVRISSIFGGVSKKPQLASLKSGVDIVIGTPGRLSDLMEMKACHLKEVSFVVLDEADRMLDMGFREEVRDILSKTSSVRQMIMFSATWLPEVNKLSEEYMNSSPIKVIVGSEDTAANHDIMQIVEVLDENMRDKRLLALLEKYHKSQKNRVLVFALYQNEVERLERFLKTSGWMAVSMHGKRAQDHRTKALATFRDGSCPLLVATDVAARGLDIPNVEVVINYTFPLTTEDYVHRIGRTGRAGNKGIAHTFFTPRDKKLAGELVNVLREAGQVVPSALTKFGTHVKKKESKLYGAHFRDISAETMKPTKKKFSYDDDGDGDDVDETV